MPPSLLAVSAFNDHLVGTSLLSACLITESGLTPGSYRTRTSDRRLTFTTTVRVIARVHYGTADCRTNAEVTGLTCLTDLNGVVLDVADLTDCSLAVGTDISHFAGGETYHCKISFTTHKLSLCACGTNELTALAGIKFDIVDESTNGNVCKGKCVAGDDIRVSTGVKNCAVSYAYRSEDVALLSCFVLNECDIRGSVRVVFDTDDCLSSGVLSLEVDYTVLLTVSAALMTNGDSAVAVTARVLFL